MKSFSRVCATSTIARSCPIEITSLLLAPLLFCLSAPNPYQILTSYETSLPSDIYTTTRSPPFVLPRPSSTFPTSSPLQLFPSPVLTTPHLPTCPLSASTCTHSFSPMTSCGAHCKAKSTRTSTCLPVRGTAARRLPYCHYAVHSADAAPGRFCWVTRLRWGSCWRRGGSQATWVMTGWLRAPGVYVGLVGYISYVHSLR